MQKQPKIKLSEIEAPKAIESEKGVLSFLLFNPDKFQEISSIISADHFFYPSYKALFELMDFKIKDGGLYDFGILCQLIEDKKLDLIPTLSEISVNTPIEITLPTHIKNIVDKHKLRSLLSKIGEIAVDISNMSHDADGVVHRANESVQKLYTESSAYETIKMIDVALENQKLKERISNGNEPSKISTGFDKLDAVTGGLNAGDVWIIAARTGCGKTAMAVNIAHHIAYIQKKTVGYITLEMDTNQVFDRIVSHHGKINYSNIIKHKFYNSEAERYDAAVCEMAEAPIFYNKGLTLQKKAFSGLCLSMIRKGAQAIIIDYLQLIDGDKNEESRVQELSQISRMIKLTSMQFKIPIIALAQLKRMSDDEEPTSAHIRECGAIEQDASVVLLCHRFKKDGVLTSDAYYKIDKNRFGPCEKILCDFDGTTQTWKEKPRDAR